MKVVLSEERNESNSLPWFPSVKQRSHPPHRKIFKSEDKNKEQRSSILNITLGHDSQISLLKGEARV